MRENGQKDQDDESSGPWNKKQTDNAIAVSSTPAPPVQKEPPRKLRFC